MDAISYPQIEKAMDKVIQTLLKNYPQSKNGLWITLFFPSYISIRQEL